MNFSVNWELARTIAAGWVIGNVVYTLLCVICGMIAGRFRVKP